MNVSDEKVKKKEGDMAIPLERTQDILKFLGEHKTDGQFLCGFSMETQNMLENSRAKLEKKNLDMIIANNLKVAGAGFGVDTNVITLITRDSVTELPIMSKEMAAKVSARMGLGLCADCTALEAEGDDLVMYRPALSGSLIAKIVSCTRPASCPA